jgi:uncharacterized SAM-dependent methyltransferase
MSILLPVAFHSSRFPDRVEGALLHSLRSRVLNPGFLYDGTRQTRRWLRLHEAWSPSRTDPTCATIYEQAADSLPRISSDRHVVLVGLGCGGGRKDTRFLQRLRPDTDRLVYAPCDVSAAMVLTAAKAARTEARPDECRPLVCDLVETPDLPERLDEWCGAEPARLITFFGMLPNLEPDAVMPSIAGSLRPGETLMVSANLVPGDDPASGMNRVFPQYDNALTREWLLGFLLDLGVGRDDGELFIGIPDQSELEGRRRIVADFRFRRQRVLELPGETFRFGEGDEIRLFHSWRYTTAAVRALLLKRGLVVDAEWVANSGEEGVFSCRRQPKR